VPGACASCDGGCGCAVDYGCGCVCARVELGGALPEGVMAQRLDPLRAILLLYLQRFLWVDSVDRSIVNS